MSLRPRSNAAPAASTVGAADRLSAVLAAGLRLGPPLPAAVPTETPFVLSDKEKQIIELMRTHNSKVPASELDLWKQLHPENHPEPHPTSDEEDSLSLAQRRASICKRKKAKNETADAGASICRQLKKAENEHPKPHPPSDDDEDLPLSERASICKRKKAENETADAGASICRHRKKAENETADAAEKETAEAVANRVQGVTLRYFQKTRVAVPEHMMDAFVESELISQLSNSFLNYAADILPQYEGVEEGDWEALYSMDKEFPQIDILYDNWGKEWEGFIEEIKKELLRMNSPNATGKISWFISGRGTSCDIDYEDFEKLVDDFLCDNWHSIRELNTRNFKEMVKPFIENFKEIVLKKRGNPNDIEDEGEEEGA
jgi:hypothetical protein